MSGGKSSSASNARPRAEEFARRDSDTTDPNAAAGRNDETDPGLIPSVGPSFKLIALRGPKAGSEFSLDAAEATLGRGADNPISIPDISVSRTHVRFKRDGDSVSVTDLKSGNGTKVNGARIESAVLKHGDEIALGDTVLQFVQVGEPLVPSASAAAPAGQSAAPSVPTESRQSPIIAIPTRQVQAPVIIGKPGPAPTPQAAAQAKRVRRLLTMIVFVLVASGSLYAWKHWGDIGDALLVHSTGESKASTDTLLRLRPLIRDRQWMEVAKKLREEAPRYPDDARLQDWAKDAQAEADAEVGFEKARDALQRGDYKESMDRAGAVDMDADFGEDAQKLLKTMPGALDMAVRDAEAAWHAGDRKKAQDIVDRVLEANPNHQGALDLKEELGRPVAKKATTQAPVDEPPPQPPPPQAPKYPCYGPAITALESDDIPSALHWANSKPVPTCPNLSGMITDFDNRYRSATEKEQGKHIPEAAIEFTRALAIITEIMKDRPSKPGRTVHEHLANMQYLLALDAKGDDQLPRRAQHLKAAIDANPQSDLARRELDRVYTHARELFQDAYIQKPSAPDVSLKEFKIVANTLPPTDEKQVKALNWIKKLQGAPQP